jgi:hypothetical protein
MEHPQGDDLRLGLDTRTPYVKAGPSLRFDPDDVIRWLTGYPKTEEASLRDDEWKTIRGA